MTRPKPPPVRAEAPPLRERAGGPTQDELLDEALKETFPASDPVSVYRLDWTRGLRGSPDEFGLLGFGIDLFDIVDDVERERRPQQYQADDDGATMGQIAPHTFLDEVPLHLVQLHQGGQRIAA